MIVQIGVNDSCIDKSPNESTISLPIHTYEQNLRWIIEAVSPLCSKVLFVGLSACDESHTTPVPWAKSSYTNARIQTYENTMKAVAEAHSIAFIPLFDVFMSEIRAGKSYLADGLHPNNEGHTFISEVILAKIAPLLEELSKLSPNEA